MPPRRLPSLTVSKRAIPSQNQNNGQGHSIDLLVTASLPIHPAFGNSRSSFCKIREADYSVRLNVWPCDSIGSLLCSWRDFLRHALDFFARRPRGRFSRSYAHGVL